MKILFCSVLILGLAGTSSFGVIRGFDNDSTDGLWRTASNWNPDGVPVLDTDAVAVGSGLTALIDAAYMETNTIAYDPFNKNLLQQYFDSGVILRITGLDELGETVGRLLSDPIAARNQIERQKTMKQNLGINIDGNTHLRIEQALAKLSHAHAETV